MRRLSGKCSIPAGSLNLSRFAVHQVFCFIIGLSPEESLVPLPSQTPPCSAQLQAIVAGGALRLGGSGIAAL